MPVAERVAKRLSQLLFPIGWASFSFPVALISASLGIFKMFQTILQSSNQTGTFIYQNNLCPTVPNNGSSRHAPSCCRHVPGPFSHFHVSFVPTDTINEINCKGTGGAQMRAQHEEACCVWRGAGWSAKVGSEEGFCQLPHFSP